MPITVNLTQGTMFVLLVLLCSACATVPMGYPKVLPAGSEQQSHFWSDRVVYPFPVQQAKVTDAGEHPWTLTYMDVGKGSNTIVLIHGRGANAGYFSGIMNQLVRKHYRVIAVDLPNYGKSLALNYEQPLTRSLQDCRYLIHQLLSAKLGLKSYAMLGHSMGGQFAIGYALNYPDEVKALILESSYGLEEFPQTVKIEKGKQLDLFDPEYQHSMSQWQQVWEPLGYLDAVRKQSEEDIRKEYFRSNATSTETPIYLNRSPDSLFMFNLRTDMISANQTLFERFVQVYSRDFYNMGVETRRNDANSLVKHLDELKMPVFMAFGAQDHLLPVANLSGNKSIINDLALPAWLQLLSRNNLPVVVSYADAGHAIHADIADVFAHDVDRFIKHGRVTSEQVKFDYH